MLWMASENCHRADFDDQSMSAMAIYRQLSNLSAHIAMAKNGCFQRSALRDLTGARTVQSVTGNRSLRLSRVELQGKLVKMLRGDAKKTG
jgi:hypothetical protein